MNQNSRKVKISRADWYDFVSDKEKIRHLTIWKYESKAKKHFETNHYRHDLWIIEEEANA